MNCDILILKWEITDDFREKIFVDIFYLKEDSYFYLWTVFDFDTLKEFKNNRNKCSYIENIIKTKNYLLNEDITHLDEIKNFIKKCKLQSKIRHWKVKKVMKK